MSTQRTAASASNPIIQRAILFEPERVPVSPFFRRRFPHLVVKEIPAPGIENVSFTPRSEMVVVRPCPSTLNEVPFFPRLRQTPLARRIDFRNR